MALCATVRAHAYPSLGPCKTLFPGCQGTGSVVPEDPMRQDSGDKRRKWPLKVTLSQGQVAEFASELLVPAPLSCPWYNTARGEGEKGPWAIFPVCFKYFPLHKHLQLFMEHWSAQHWNAISLCISEIFIRISRLTRCPRLTLWNWEFSDFPWC